MPSRHAQRDDAAPRRIVTTSSVTTVSGITKPIIVAENTPSASCRAA